jgi:subtilisin family serine protease
VGNYTASLISQQDGIDLVQKAIPANETISFPNASYAYPVATAGLVSDFSTYGPTYDMFLKPAVTAPGGNILSTFPVALGAYKLDSGTSMAAPFVAGSAALLLQARGKSAAVAKSARGLFETTARPARHSPANTSLLESAAHQGAGLVQVYDAVKSLGSMSPAELLLNDTANFERVHKVTIRNGAKRAVTYRLVHVPAGTANTITGIENNRECATCLEPGKD